MDKNGIEEIKKIYESQCPAIYNQGMNGDNNLLTILAIGRNSGFDYLQCLVDSYDQFRIMNPDKIVSPSEWADMPNNKHFKTAPLKDMRVAVPKKGKDAGVQMTTYKDFATSCMSSFSGRMCGKLLLSNAFKINDSIEDTVNIIDTTMDLIQNEIKNERTCPFQLDLIIGSGKPQTQENTDIGVGGM